MSSPSIKHMFTGFQYQKTMEEVAEAMVKKVEGLLKKIEDRKVRIAKICAEYGITDSDMIQLLGQATQRAVSNRVVDATQSFVISSSDGQADASDEKVIAAGVVQNILTERSLIDTERASVRKMQSISRNLKPTTHNAEDGSVYTIDTVDLDLSELKYLGF